MLYKGCKGKNSVKYVWTEMSVSSSYHVVIWSAASSVRWFLANVQSAVDPYNRRSRPTFLKKKDLSTLMLLSLSVNVDRL